MCIRPAKCVNFCLLLDQFFFFFFRHNVPLTKLWVLAVTFQGIPLRQLTHFCNTQGPTWATTIKPPTPNSHNVLCEYQHHGFHFFLLLWEFAAVLRFPVYHCNWVSSGLTDDKSVTKIIITYSPKMVLYKNIPLLTSCAWVGRWVTKLLMSERQPQKQLCSIQQLGHHCAGLLRTWRAMFLISGISFCFIVAETFKAYVYFAVLQITF